MTGGRAATEAIVRGQYAISVNDPGHPTPAGWVRVLLSEIADLGTGHTPSRKHPEYWDGVIPWIGIRDAGTHHSGVITDTLQHISELGLANSAARLLPSETVCLSRTASVGYVVMMGRSMATSQDFVTWSCGNALEPKFLMRALLAEGENIRRFGEGSTHTTIYFPELKAFHIDLPPLAEQRRIVSKIDTLSAMSSRGRDHLDHIPHLVEKYKQAVLAAAFQGDLTREWRCKNTSLRWTESEYSMLKGRREAYHKSRRGSRLQSHEEPADSFPQEWFGAQLADVGQLQVGYAYKSKWYSPEGVRLLRGANVAPGSISWEDTVRLPPETAIDFEEYRLNVGDIVIAMDRPIIAAGLKVARVQAEDAGCLLVQRVARYVASELVDKHYVWYLINSKIFLDHAVRQSTGSDLPHISSNDILTTPIPLPCVDEQQEIVERVTLALSWIDRLAAEASSARKLVDRLDQAILSKAFRGELVPQDPADEPASVLLDRLKADRKASDGPKRGRKSKAA